MLKKLPGQWWKWNLKTDGFLGGWGERSRRVDAKFRTMHIRWWGYLIHLSVQIVNTDSLESQQSLIRNSGNSTIFKFLCVCAVFGCVCLTEWVCICMFARLTSIVLHSDSRLPILVLSSWAYKIIRDVKTIQSLLWKQVLKRQRRDELCGYGDAVWHERVTAWVKLI